MADCFQALTKIAVTRSGGQTAFVSTGSTTSALVGNLTVSGIVTGGTVTSQFASQTQAFASTLSGNQLTFATGSITTAYTSTLSVGTILDFSAGGGTVGTSLYLSGTLVSPVGSITSLSASTITAGSLSSQFGSLGNLAVSGSAQVTGTFLSVGRGIANNTTALVNIAGSNSTVNVIAHNDQNQYFQFSNNLVFAGVQSTVVKGLSISAAGLVGINNASPAFGLDIIGNTRVSTGTLGTLAGDQLMIHNMTGRVSNGLQLQSLVRRTAPGTDWTSSTFRLQTIVDASTMSYQDFNAGGNAGAIAWGSGSIEGARLNNGNLSVNGSFTSAYLNTNLATASLSDTSLDFSSGRDYVNRKLAGARVLAELNVGAAFGSGPGTLSTVWTGTPNSFFGTIVNQTFFPGFANGAIRVVGSGGIIRTSSLFDKGSITSQVSGPNPTVRLCALTFYPGSQTGSPGLTLTLGTTTSLVNASAFGALGWQFVTMDVSAEFSNYQTGPMSMQFRAQTSDNANFIYIPWFAIVQDTFVGSLTSIGGAMSITGGVAYVSGLTASTVTVTSLTASSGTFSGSVTANYFTGAGALIGGSIFQPNAIGVNTTSPAYSLDVVGSARITGSLSAGTVISSSLAGNFGSVSTLTVGTILNVNLNAGTLGTNLTLTGTLLTQVASITSLIVTGNASVTQAFFSTMTGNQLSYASGSITTAYTSTLSVGTILNFSAGGGTVGTSLYLTGTLVSPVGSISSLSASTITAGSLSSIYGSIGNLAVSGSAQVSGTTTSAYLNTNLAAASLSDTSLDFSSGRDYVNRKLAGARVLAELNVGIAFGSGPGTLSTVWTGTPTSYFGTIVNQTFFPGFANGAIRVVGGGGIIRTSSLFDKGSITSQVSGPNPTVRLCALTFYPGSQTGSPGLTLTLGTTTSLVSASAFGALGWQFVTMDVSAEFSNYQTGLMPMQFRAQTSDNANFIYIPWFAIVQDTFVGSLTSIGGAMSITGGVAYVSGLTASTVTATSLTAASGSFSGSLTANYFTGAGGLIGGSIFQPTAIGVNTTSPAYSLDVVGSARVGSGNTAWYLGTVAGFGGGAFIQNATMPLTAISSFALYQDNNSISVPNTLLNAAPNGTVQLQIGNATKMILNSTGNVGINTTSPAYTLDVAGSARVTGSLSASTISATNSNVTGTLTASSISSTFLTVSTLSGSLANLNQISASTISIGTTTSAYPVDILGTSRIARHITASFARTLPAVLNAATNIAVISNANLGYHADLVITQTQSFSACAIKYAIPVSFNITAGAWHRCLPLTQTTTYFSSTLAVDIMVSNNTSTFRLVRTSVPTTTTMNDGSSSATLTPLTSFTCELQLVETGSFPLTVTDDSTASTGVTFAKIYMYTPLTTQYGNVGIMTATPAFTLDVLSTSSADKPSINPEATNTLLIYEDCQATSLNAGVLTGNAVAPTASNKYIVLTSTASSQFGHVYWNMNPGNAWTWSAEYYVGDGGTPTFPTGGDAAVIYWSATALPGSTAHYTGVAGGYGVHFADYTGSTTPGGSGSIIGIGQNILLSYNGAALYQAPLNIPRSSWNQIKIVFQRNLVRVYLNNVAVITFQDVNRVITGRFAGMAGGTGGAVNNHWVRNIRLSKYAEDTTWSQTGLTSNAICYNAGNVGINNSTPLFPLDVNGSCRVTGTLTSAVLTNVTTPAYPLDVTGSTRLNNGLFSSVSSAMVLLNQNQAASANTSFALYQGASGDTAINAASGTPLGLKVGNVEYARLSSAGLLGVNTTTPAFNLDVNGSARIVTSGGLPLLIQTGSSTSNGLQIQLSGTGGAQDVGIGFNQVGITSYGIVQRAGANGRLAFVNNLFPGSAGIEQVSILASNGNVGIGNTAPAYTLDVNGSARVTGSVIVSKQVPWTNLPLNTAVATQYGGNFGAAQYSKDAFGIVRLRGLINVIATGVWATLPSSCWPVSGNGATNYIIVPVITPNFTMRELQVSFSGTMQAVGSAAPSYWVSLDNATWDTSVT